MSQAQVASSAAAVPYSRIRELAEIAMAKAARGETIYRLYFGESNLPTPPFIKQAAARAIEGGHTYYTENAGMPSLKRELAAHYERLHGVSVDPARIVVTASGVQALNVTIRCTLDPGDEAIILTPAWPNGSAIVEMANARPVQIPHPLVDGRYAIDYEALERAVTPRTRLLLYTSPSNPLGWVAAVEDQRRLLEFARRHRLWLLADEVYERLYFGGTAAPSILKQAEPEDAVIVCQSFSKTYCMTGWRLGWFIARRDLARRAGELNEFIISHATSFIQKAAETALREGEPWVEEMMAQLRRNREHCLAALRGIPGITVPEPEGAFYLFPRVAGLTDSFGFCRRLLEATGVGTAPGVAFGAGGEGSFRICYAAEERVLEPALDKLVTFLHQ